MDSQYIEQLHTLTKLEFILITSSKPRIEIFRRTGLRFRVFSHSYDENLNYDDFKNDFNKYTEEISRLKLIDFYSRLSDNNVQDFMMDKDTIYILISADTLAVCDNIILGKPHNSNKATEMLQLLQGRWHTVCTGLCVMLLQEKNMNIINCDTQVSSVVSNVKMKHLDSFEIEQYVATGEPLDKAGSYAIQGIGKKLIDTVTGSEDNVAGLPLKELLCIVVQLLKKYF